MAGNPTAKRKTTRRNLVGTTYHDLGRSRRGFRLLHRPRPRRPWNGRRSPCWHLQSRPARIAQIMGFPPEKRRAHRHHRHQKCGTQHQGDERRGPGVVQKARGKSDCLAAPPAPSPSRGAPNCPRAGRPDADVRPGVPPA